MSLTGTIIWLLHVRIVLNRLPTLFENLNDPQGIGVGVVENPNYLTEQLVTYIGNKRTLLPEINKMVIEIRQKLGSRKLKTLDLFSGSGGVARLLKQHSDLVITNDIEPYSATLNRCFLSNANQIDFEVLGEIVERLNRRTELKEFSPGFISEMYAPQDEENIQNGERVFYTKDNALRLDSYAQWIREEAIEYQELLLGPLLSKASVHVNTSGVFKGFYKDSETGKGMYGGLGQNALQRIMGKIELQLPVLSYFESEYQVYTDDAVNLVNEISNIDIAYLDPPYNQHPYGSNYFMLNLINKYLRPKEVSKVSGIPSDWSRSDFNVKKKISFALDTCIENLDAKFVILSFNDEGFLSPEELRRILAKYGKISEEAIEYNTYRGSRNLKNRNDKVTEHLFCLEK